MTAWQIPADKIINYSPTGDDIDSFSEKVKYTLEEIANHLNDVEKGLQIGGESVVLEGLSSGDTLIYDAGRFVNAPRLDVAQVQAILDNSGLNSRVNHLQRLVENIYLTFDVADLNPGGYDGLQVATFFGDLSCLDTARSNFTLTDGKISGNGATLVTTPIFFVNTETGESRQVTRAHLIVKPTNVYEPQLTADVALWDGITETFAPMTKSATYPDKDNPYRATTEFIYAGTAGNSATLRINASGEFWIDSFACTFDE